jgi:hypothetical protein
MKAKKCRKCGGGKFRAGVCTLCDLFRTAQPPGGTATSTWPMKSLALGVHPKSVAEATERNRRHGIRATYDENGDCHLPDAGERRKLLKLQGLHDKDAFI